MRTTLRNLFTSLLGEFSWRPPSWLTRFSLACEDWTLRHRRASRIIGTLLVALIAGGLWLYDWYQHRPVPETVSVDAITPGVPALTDKKQTPPPLTIRFGKSVSPLAEQTTASLQLAGSPIKLEPKPISAGIRMEPPLAGAWHWKNDKELVFQPATEWPADQLYKIALDPSVVSPHVLLARYAVEARTPPFSATIPKIEFYTDPNDPGVKQIIATLTFSHRVEEADVSGHLQLTVLGGSEIFPPTVPHFTLTAGDFQRTYYLRTSALNLPEQEDFLRVTLEKGVATRQGGATTASEVQQKVRVPDLYSFFKVESATGEIVRSQEGEPEQIIFIKTRGAAKPADMQKALHVYLLPEKPADEDEDQKQARHGKPKKKPHWESAEEVDDEVLTQATQLAIRPVPTDKENTDLHCFKISIEKEGELYVTVDKGLKAMGGFVLRESYAKIIPVPPIPREITIESEGGLLALSGERKLSIKSRGVARIQYEIARVPADQINHLVSQTRGDFQNPDFVNYNFGPENIARIATEEQSIVLKNKFKPNYSAFDFTRYLHSPKDGGTPTQGLFFLKAKEWLPPKVKPAKDDKDREIPTADDPDSDKDDDADSDEEQEDDSEENSNAPVKDSRFILVTDLGLIVKETTDGSRDVFIASIKTGEPLADVSVEVLGKNGVPLESGKTSPEGRILFSSLGKPTREKTPVAFVARFGQDVAFMPYSREDRQLDFSRFDTGGVRSRSGTDLDGFIFTERGIYRPGDEIRIGLIVKQRDWAGQLEGLPIETEVIDARGATVQVRKLALPAIGFAETSYQTAYESPSGIYTIRAYIVRDGKRDLLLAQQTVHVKEFLPDRMKIESQLSKHVKSGWITPDDVHAQITLRNLYGTPAAHRRIKSHMVLAPGAFQFEEFPGFTFFDRLRDDKKELKRQQEELGDSTTNEDGAATVDLSLERFADATYALTFYTEGFEADGGRSVMTANSVLVSPLPYVVGAKPDSDFSYVQMGSAHAVEWIALNPSLQKIAVENLECRLLEHTYVSVLTKQENGNYSYESVMRENVIRTEPLSLPAEGYKYALPTDVPGSYVLELRDKEAAQALSRVSFAVIGRGAVSRSLEKNAELEVKLSRPQYNTGDEIEISVVAPYTGSGLITIERDKVYAHAWFKADRTSTVQHIRVPADFEGTGYVNVCFVRALDSKEVFMSPLSYATVPFQANTEKRRLPITLNVEKKHRPGEPLRIGYKTDRPSRIAIFAVDQGILQVSNYQLPDPLEHFFRKEALMVQTKQIVDLLLPEYSILRRGAAFGGDGEGHLNPFKRVTEKPVVFWSGIVDAGPREQQVVYDVPDYFSGTLTVMAVAMAPDAVGSSETTSLVRGPFVLSPNVPTVAAPGDLFEVSVAIANGVEGSGDHADVRVAAKPSEHLEIVKAPTEPVRIPEGHEVSVTFAVRAREKLGSATLAFTAALPGQETRLRSTLSVRPAVPFMTSVHSGNFTKESTDLKVERTLHPDFRKLDATIAALPLGLARGLDLYLKNYPNGCSEQITSMAFCRLALADEVDFGLNRSEVNAQLEKTFATLRRRQNDAGAFGYWYPDKNDGIDFVSTYVMHFLIEAKAAGFVPPVNVYQAGLKHLQEMVAQDPGNLREARIVAYAIYLLSREGVVTTNYVLNLRDYLEHNYEKQWTKDLTGVYLAAAYSLLKKQDEANRLIKNYRLGTHDRGEFWDFYSPLGADAQYVAIVSRHFPEIAKKITASEFQAITKPIGNGDFSTLSAAYAVLALKGYSHQLAQHAPELGIVELAASGAAANLRLDGSALLKRGTFSANAASLRFSARNQNSKLGAFYQMVEAGYDSTLPQVPVSDGLEVIRALVDEHGEPVTTAHLGDPITVRLRMRSLTGAPITNVAIVDLLPGGFEFAADSLEPGAGHHGFDFIEVREDRAVFFGNIGPDIREVLYQIKPTNRGEYVVPPAFAESMYDRSIKARALATRIKVVDGK